jgi:SAM-dependent methyltransferase
VDAIRKLFDSIADGYDAQGVEFFGPIAQGLVAAVEPRSGERALDVGCGRGAALLPLVQAGAVVTGIDLSPRMVALAQEVAPSADVRVGDAMQPDLPAESFDVVVSSLVLFFLPDPAAALLAWRELLVDDGRIGVSTFGPYSEQWRETVDVALRAHVPAAVTDARTTGASGPFASDEGMEALVRDAGFRDVRTTTATVSPRFDDPEHWYRFSMTVGQRQFWNAVPPDRLDVVKEGVFAAVDTCRVADGRIGFDQVVRYTLARR